MEEEASPFRRPFPTARALLTTEVAGVIVTIVVACGARVAGRMPARTVVAVGVAGVVIVTAVVVAH